MVKRFQLGDLLGSLRYFGKCFICGIQFMSTSDTLYLVNGTKRCPKCKDVLTKDQEAKKKADERMIKLIMLTYEKDWNMTKAPEKR